MQRVAASMQRGPDGTGGITLCSYTLSPGVSNLSMQQSPGPCVQTDRGAHSQGPGSVGVRWSLRFCVSNKMVMLRLWPVDPTLGITPSDLL